MPKNLIVLVARWQASTHYCLYFIKYTIGENLNSVWIYN
jgi:hypothetical protein